MRIDCLITDEHLHTAVLSVAIFARSYLIYYRVKLHQHMTSSFRLVTGNFLIQKYESASEDQGQMQSL